MTDRDLIERGYKEYPPTHPFHSTGVEKFFQKCFRDDKGKRYYLNVNKWRTLTHPHTGETIGPNYEFSVQLYQKGTHNPINLLFHSNWDIDAVEKHMKVLFLSGEYDYYELFE